MLGINTPIGSGFSPNTLYSLSCFHNKELTPRARERTEGSVWTDQLVPGDELDIGLLAGKVPKTEDGQAKMTS